MIVPSMTSEELFTEIIKDYSFVVRKAIYLTDSLRRDAVKSKDKHIQRIFEYKSSSKNDWLILVDYLVKDPTFVVTVCYHDRHGFNGIMIGKDSKDLTHFTPHFLARYNERFLKQEQINKKELFKRFISMNSVGFIIPVDDTDEMKNRFFARFREGLGLGYIENFNGNRDTIQHFKTFISNEMIFESQQEVFNVSGKEYESYWNEIFKHKDKGAFG